METFRTAALWVVLPVCIYSCIPITGMFCVAFTPECVRQNPKCALWTICFSTVMGYFASGERLAAGLVTLTLAIVWHSARYWLLFQLSYDPILKLVLSDREGLIEELRNG